MTKTYNNYITEGIKKGTITEEEGEGVRVYKVRKPEKGEEVDGYTNFSDTFVKPKEGSC